MGRNPLIKFVETVFQDGLELEIQVCVFDISL